MDIPTGTAEHLADLTRAQKKKARALKKDLPKISRKRLAEMKAYEKEGYKALKPKTRIGNLAGGPRASGGMGGGMNWSTK